MKTFALFLSLLLAFSFSGAAQQTTLTLTAAQLGTAAATLASAADAEGGTDLQYKWYKNGVEVGGATAATYTVPAADYAEGTATITYTRAAKCAECADWLFANPVAVTICAAAALPTVSLDYACAANQTATFTATGGNGANEFAWSTDNGATYAAFAAAGTQAVNLATAQAATRFVKARSTANGCLSSPVSLMASVPTTPTITGVAPAVGYTQNRVSHSITFTISTIAGGSGTAAGSGYGWGVDAHNAAAPSITWQASSTRTGTVTLPATAVAAGVTPTLYLRTQDSKTCLSSLGSVPVHLSIPAGVAFNANSAYNGNLWVDAWSKTGTGTSLGCGTTTFTNSESDGRTLSAMQYNLSTCNLRNQISPNGLPWYVPAPQELLRWFAVDPSRATNYQTHSNAGGKKYLSSYQPCASQSIAPTRCKNSSGVLDANLTTPTESGPGSASNDQRYGYLSGASACVESGCYTSTGNCDGSTAWDICGTSSNYSRGISSPVLLFWRP